MPPQCAAGATQSDSCENTRRNFSREAITLPVGLLVLTQSGYTQRGLAFSGGFIATVPPIIVYAFFQRQIVQGMTTAGLAGR